MAQGNQKKTVDDIVDRWNENPIQEESDRVFNHIPSTQEDSSAQNTESEKRSFWDRRADKRLDDLDQDYASREDRRKAEVDELNAAENHFNYRKAGDQQPTNPARRFSQLLNKKNALRGGIAGGGIGIALALFSFLTPFKIPGVMQLITDHAGQRLEQITTHRAKVIVARYIYSQVGIPGDPVITGKGPVSSLIATMRTNNFEKKLAAKGLTFEKSGTGVKLKFNGKDMGVYKNPDAIAKALDADRLTNAMFNDIVKEEIPTWRYFKRAKFAKWLKLRTNVRFGAPKSNETDKNKKLQEMQETRVKEANARSTDNALKMLDCVSEGPKCPMTDLKNGQQTTLGSSDEAKDAVQKTLTETSEEVASEAGEAAIRGGVDVGTKLSTKIAAKAIPIVGWISLAATLSHFSVKAYEAAEDDMIFKIPAYFRSQSYAQIYAEWAGYGDQVKAGEMDQDFLGVLASQMDGIEQSQAYSCLSSTQGTGNIVASLTGTAYAAEESCTKSGVPVKERIDENNPSKLKQALDKQKEVLGFSAPEIYKFTPSYWVLEGWYLAENKLTDVATSIIFAQYKLGFELLNYITERITGVDAQDVITQWMSQVINKYMNQMLSMMGLTIDPLDKGADLGNDLLGGGLVSFFTFCKELGCRKLTTQQANAQDNTIAQEKAQELADKGWLYATFSPDAVNSVTNQLAVALPSALSVQSLDLVSGGTQLASLVTSIPTRVSNGLLGGTAKADDPVKVSDLYGLDYYGANASDLIQDVAPEAITGDECPEVAEGDYNNCSIDKTVAEAMICNFEPNSPDCNFLTENVGTGGQFRMATFNLLGAIHSSNSNAKSRLERALKIMRDNSFDIVGMQEVDELQYNEIIKQGTEFDIFPKGKYGTHDGHRNSIIWKRDKFTLIQDGSGTKPFKYFDGEDEQYPYVKLMDNETKQTFIVFNTHDPTSSNSRGNQSKWRVYDAKVHLKNMEEANANGTPVFMTGDFNSAFVIRSPEDNGLSRNELTYCILTSTGKINNAYDVFNKKSGTCPTTKAEGEGSKIDHIYMTAGVEVSRWQKINDADVNYATDHPVVYVDIVIPGAGSNSNTGDVTASGFAWPLSESGWKKNRSAFLGSHGATGTAWGSDNMGTSGKGPYIAVDISQAVGVPVHAMYSGTVTSTSLCGVGDGIAIKSTVNGKTFGISYMHGKNKKFKVGEKVEAGQEIMEVGSIGCNVRGAHFHIGMAYDGKYLCPQDVFLGMDKGGTIDLAELTKKTSGGCGR